MPDDPWPEQVPQQSAPSPEEMHARMQEVIAEIRKSNRTARVADGPVGRPLPPAARDPSNPLRR